MHRGPSPATNAMVHAGSKCVVKLDLVSFFPSVTCAMVYASWETQFGFGPPITPVLTRLTTHKGHLPQGSPTSGYLANLALIPCIPQIRAVVESLGCTVSFYVEQHHDLR